MEFWTIVWGMLERKEKKDRGQNRETWGVRMVFVVFVDLERRATRKKNTNTIVYIHV